jgi:hypothetical protein
MNNADDRERLSPKGATFNLLPGSKTNCRHYVLEDVVAPGGRPLDEFFDGFVVDFGTDEAPKVVLAVLCPSRGSGFVFDGRDGASHETLLAAALDAYMRASRSEG